jgi:hypothetical protein
LVLLTSAAFAEAEALLALPLALLLLVLAGVDIVKATGEATDSS